MPKKTKRKTQAPDPREYNPIIVWAKIDRYSFTSSPSGSFLGWLGKPVESGYEKYIVRKARYK